MFFKSLKREILVFTLSLTILTIAVTTVFGAYSLFTAGTDAEQATNSTLRDQAKDFLIQIARSAAEGQDVNFEQVKTAAGSLASYTKNLYENPSVFRPAPYWTFDRRMFLENGVYVNGESDVSTVFVPNFVMLDAREKRHVEMGAYLDFVAPSVLESDRNVAAVYMTDTSGVSRYFPNIVLGRVAPPDHNTLEDIVYAQATPEANPEKQIVWSPLYDDPAGRGLMITASAPIYAESGFEGIIGIDVLLADIIESITSYSPIEGSYAFLIDKSGETVAFPDRAYQDILGRARMEGEIRTYLASSTVSGAFADILTGMMRGEEGFGSIQSGDSELFVAYAPLPQTGFSMAVVAEESVMLKAVSALHTKISDSIQNTILFWILPVSIVIMLIASFISFILVSQIVRPVNALTRGAEEIGRGNLDYNITVDSRNEIGVLARAFNQMTQALKVSRQELYEYSQGLEQKVAERTSELTATNKRQETLLHFLSHEVKAYLTKGMYAFDAITGGDFGPVSPELSKVAHESFIEMREGVASAIDILNAASLRDGTIRYDKKSFDLRDAISHMVIQQRPLAEQKGLTITSSVPNDPVQFVGDEEKISQHVIRNLIDNAIKYSPTGEIRITLERAGEGIRFSVADTGIGITPEDMAQLFTEGGRGKDSTRINVHSSGYGLFIAKQVVEAHGGTIHAESEGVGKGSRFVVDWPVA